MRYQIQSQSVNLVDTQNKITLGKIVNNCVCLIVCNVIENTELHEKNTTVSPQSVGVKWDSGLPS